jgi:hypothetical protein
MATMYKAVNVSNDTYKELQNIATQLQKPKAQVIDTLVQVYKKATKESEKAKLEQFNKDMGAKINALQFSKPIKVDTNNIDEDFAALAKTDYLK